METVVRVTIIYVFLLMGLRALGKRELGQLSPFEVMTLLLIPEIVSQAIVGEDFSLTNALVGVSTLFCLVFLNSALSYRFKPVRRLTEGGPVILVHDGRFIDKAMDHERVSAGEIFSEMHKSGIDELSRVKWAILETDGKISIVSHEPGQAKRPSETAHAG